MVAMSDTQPLVPATPSSTETALPAVRGGTERMWSALPASSPTEGTGFRAVADDNSVDVVAGFRVGRQLGQGGMATVFEALHLASGQRCALKRVREDARKDPQFIDRFLREVRAASELDHPHICKVFAGGDDGKDVFMAVELLEGGDLDQLLSRSGGRLPAAAATVVVCELLEALAYAHKHGIVHRDIKPANVMLSGDGVVKLVDFGIARKNDDVRLTATGLVVGTPAYMSPEQARGQDLDARSDLFSVGVLFVELLTGVNPFHGDTATATVMKILTEQLPPLSSVDPTIPGVVSVVVEGLLQRDPARRYPSAQAALDDLAAYRRLVELATPDLLKQCLRDAAEARRALLARQAAFEIERANDLAALGEPGLAAAALALYRATRLEPDSEVARARFVDLCARGGFDFDPKDPRIVDVEANIKRQPFQGALLKRAADLHKAAKNPQGQASWLQRYLQLTPNDELARRQWMSLVSGPSSPTLAREKLSTREIVDGIKTGGWKSADHRTETTFKPIDALLPPEPKPKPAPPQRQRVVPEGQRIEPQVVVHNVGGGNSNAAVIVVAAVVAVCVSAVIWFGSRSKEALDQSARNTGAAGLHQLDASPELQVMALDNLERARKAAAAKNGADAIDAAELALTSSQLGPDEQLEAMFVKARGLELIGDRAGARLAVDKYLKAARIGHPNHDAALELEKRVK